MNKFLKCVITKDFILKHVTPEEIFLKYLGLTPNYKILQKASHRKDPKPSVAFKKTLNGDIICKDFGDKRIQGDCFNIVSGLYSCTYTDSYEIIAKDFNLIESISNSITSIRKIYKPDVLSDSVEKNIIPIKIKKKPWSQKGLDFWQAFGISKRILDFYNVCEISHYWYNDNIRSINTLAFAYYFKPYEYKIYLPFEKIYRFICNTTYLQGYNQLPKNGDLLIYTKSLKDVMLLYKYGVNSVSTQAEGNMLNQKWYDRLIVRFPKQALLYDFDYAGLTGSGKIKRRYNIPRIALSNGRYNTTDYGAKDLSDYYEANGDKKTRELINKIKQHDTFAKNTKR